MSLLINQTGQQNLIAASASGRPMGARRQSVSEVISYAVDYSNWLPPGEILSNVIAAVSSSAAQQMIVASLTINSSYNGVTFQLSGGIASVKYEIELVATTISGQVKVDTFYVTVLPLPVQSAQTIALPPSNVFMSQFKRALASGYAPLGIPANSVNTIQLSISADPSQPDNLQWFSGLYISSGDPVWLKVQAQWSLTSSQTDQFLTYASKLAA